jgi:hypothetical protein
MPRPTVPIVQDAGWAPEPVWTHRLEEKSYCLCQGSNLDRPVVQPVARHYTDWATRLSVLRVKPTISWPSELSLGEFTIGVFRLYSRDAHKGTREPHTVLARHWCGSLKIPLTMYVFKNKIFCFIIAVRTTCSSVKTERQFDLMNFSIEYWDKNMMYR